MQAAEIENIDNYLDADESSMFAPPIDSYSTPSSVAANTVR